MITEKKLHKMMGDPDPKVRAKALPHLFERLRERPVIKPQGRPWIKSATIEDSKNDN